MTEPENLTLVLIGNLTDNDPWDLELWCRDDANARGSNARWYRAGLSDDSPDFTRMSWERLEEHARDIGHGLTITVLGSGAR